MTIVDLVRADYVRIRDLLTRYADLKLGFVDAAVIAIVERLNERKLATLDHRHFTNNSPQAHGCHRTTATLTRSALLRYNDMEPAGIEPATSCMPCKRSPS